MRAGRYIVFVVDMKTIKIALIIICVLAFSIKLAYTDEELSDKDFLAIKEKLEKVEELQKDIKKQLGDIEDSLKLKDKETLTQKQPVKKVDVGKIVGALNLIVQYQLWKDYQKVLERSYYIKKDDDPFAFKSKTLRELLQKDSVSQEEFEHSIEDLEHALKELKD